MGERVTDRTDERPRLIVLGSGTGVSASRRRPAGYLVRYGRRGLLLDLGPGAWHTASRFLPPDRIEAVLLSHAHLDHCLDVLTLVYSRSLQARLSGRRLRTLAIVGSPETLETVERWIRAIPGLEPTCETFVPVRPGAVLEVGEGVRVRTGAVAHIAGSLAYRVEFPDGTSLTYSGDTTWCSTLVQLAYRTSVLLLECAHDRPSRPHLWPEAAARLARWAEAEFCVLTHFYPDALTPAFRRRCRLLFQTPLALASDGAVFPIPPSGTGVDRP